MNYLLDTHALIWFLNGDESLSTTAENVMEDSENIIYVSIISLWEIAIKINLNKLTLNTAFDKIKKAIDTNNFQIIASIFEDTLVLSTLPHFHKDPFDRLLISQAINNDFILISRDEHFNNYDVKLLW